MKRRGREAALSIACGAPVVVTAFLVAVTVDSDAGDVVFLALWNSWPAVLIVVVAYLMAVRFDTRRGLATALVGAAVQCVGLMLCYGPLYHVTAGAPLAGFIFVPAALLVLSGLAMLAAGITAYVIPRNQPPSGPCSACGYDLAGLGAGAACPECGAARGIPDS